MMGVPLNFQLPFMFLYSIFSNQIDVLAPDLAQQPHLVQSIYIWQWHRFAIGWKYRQEAELLAEQQMSVGLSAKGVCRHILWLHRPIMIRIN